MKYSLALFTFSKKKCIRNGYLWILISNERLFAKKLYVCNVNTESLRVSRLEHHTLKRPDDIYSSRGSTMF